MISMEKVIARKIIKYNKTKYNEMK